MVEEEDFTEEEIEEFEEQLKEAQNYTDAQKMKVEHTRDMRDAKFQLERLKTSYYSSLSVIGLTFLLAGIEGYRLFEVPIIRKIGMALVISGFSMSVFSLYKLVSTYREYKNKTNDFIKESAKYHSWLRRKKKVLEERLDHEFKF